MSIKKLSFKRVCTILSCLVLLFPLLPITSLARAQPITINFNGRIVQSDVPPTIVGGRVLLPARVTFEAMGASVQWVQTTQTLTGRKAGVVISLVVGNRTATVNGRSVVLDQPAQIINGRTVVPLRFVSEELGAQVVWDSIRRTVVISMTPPAPSTIALPAPVQPPPIAATERWQARGSLLLLASGGCGYPNNLNMLKSLGIQGNYLGGTMRFLYDSLPSQENAIRNSDSVVILNAVAEHPGILHEWPDKYRWVLPALPSELLSYKPPFALIKSGSDGRMRGIVIAKSTTDIFFFLETMATSLVPVGMPWTIRTTQGIVAATKSEEYWQAQGMLYLLTSRDSGHPDTVNMLRSLGIRGGYLGGSLRHVYSGLSVYEHEIRPSDTVVILNATAEHPSILREWPNKYRWILPALPSELLSYKPPFALIKSGSDGRMRGIVIAKSTTDIFFFLETMATSPVPVGVPWTIRTTRDFVAATKPAEPWFRDLHTLEGDKFHIVYPEGYNADAAQMLEWADIALEGLLEFFPDAWEIINETIFIEIHKPPRVEHGWAWVDPVNARMWFVIPSLSAAEHPDYNAEWYIGNIGHEFSSIYLERHRRKAGGYKSTWNEMPRWFCEGLGEYFRYLIIGKQRFEQNLRGRYASEVTRLIRGGLAGISDVYAAGSVILQFIHDRWGLKAVKGIITSPQATFWGAIREATGLSEAEFDTQLRAWLARR